jgi:signal recognition particle subunit SRP19
MEVTPNATPGMSNPRAKKWKCVYPAYIDSSKTLDQGRLIAKEKAITNPSIQEIAEICQYFKLNYALEPHKAYPKDWMNPGRVKIEILTEDKKPANPNIKSKKELLLKMAELIPKLKSRVVGGNLNTRETEDDGGSNKKKKKKKN